MLHAMVEAMTDDNAVTVSCEGCGRRYAWRAELAGRHLRCKCGATLEVPRGVLPARAANEDLYDLAPEADQAKPKPLTVVPREAGNEPVAPVNFTSTATSPVAPALDYQRGDLGGSRIDYYFPDRVKDLWLPLAMIGGGTVIEMALGFFGRRGSISGATSAVMAVGIWMIVNTILMLIAIFLVAKLRGFRLGPLPTAIVKLCGISIGPGAFGSLVGVSLAWLPLGGLAGWLVGFILYFALIGALFDLDEPDTWWCVITIFFVKVAVALVLLRLL